MTFSLAAQSEIIMDGVFDDWANIPSVVDGDDPGVMDLLEMKVTNDEAYLYVYLRVAEEIKLVEALIPHSIYLQIDTDVDAATGYEVQEGFGSELGIDFAIMLRLLRCRSQCGREFLRHRIPSSTYCDKRSVELAIRRDAVPDGVHPLFPNNQIRMLFRRSWAGINCPIWGKNSFMHLRKTLRPSSPLLWLK